MKFKKLLEDLVADIGPKTASPVETGPINFTKHFVQAGDSHNKQFTAAMADPNELAMGIQEEYEHTLHRDIAEKIALDHLSKIKDYYTRLRKMESEARTYWEKKNEEI